MPGIPLVARRTSLYNNSRSVDDMCREDGRSGSGGVRLSSEEEIEAEESLYAYCKPVEFYNILQRRSLRNPLFMQRCLSYKIQAERNRRIQLTISLSRNVNGGEQAYSPFPLYVLVAKLIPDIGFAQHSAVYRFNRASILTNFSGVEGTSCSQASFFLPEFHKLALEANSGSLAVLLVCFTGAQSSLHGVDLPRANSENLGGCCLLGKIPLESLYDTWEQSPNFSLGQRVELTLPVSLNSCFLKLNCMKEEKRVWIQFPHDSGNMSARSLVNVMVSAEEVGAREKSPYHLNTCNEISSASRVLRLRAGNVIFNYRYYNNKMQKTEVTEDFTCPFCLVKCASFKGLGYHLRASHDLFNYEFWVTEEFQAVNISVKTDTWRSEIVADGVDPKQQTFYFCSKKRRRKGLRKSFPGAMHVQSHTLESNLRIGICELLDRADGSAAQSCPDASFGQSVSGNYLQPPLMLPFGRTRKLSIERSDLRIRTLLHKRQFFHSHRAQPMAIEQVLSDRDSEDEVDDDVADLEDRRMLDDFVDVTKDEKQMMHLWNSFVRKQRVLADGHIPWACEAFSRLHGHELVQVPALLWCWRLFMIKLWNHGLLDARAMNHCNIILEELQKDFVSM